MILRFAKEDDMDTRLRAWKLRAPAPLLDPRRHQGRPWRRCPAAWADYLERHPDLKGDFEYRVMFLMSEVMAHTSRCTARRPGRVHRFVRKHPTWPSAFQERARLLSQLSAETLSRLKHAGKI